jgi:hypothetical protein
MNQTKRSTWWKSPSFFPLTRRHSSSISQ